MHCHSIEYVMHALQILFYHWYILTVSLLNLKDQWEKSPSPKNKITSVSV